MVIKLEMPFTVNSNKQKKKLKKSNICSSLSEISDKLSEEEKQEISWYISNIVQSAQIQGQKKAEMLGDGMQKKMMMLTMASAVLSAINTSGILWMIFG